MTDQVDDQFELEKLRFDYAWKWFNFHADQRIKMFNYMLVTFGIFAAGIVNALDKQIPHKVIAILCFFASLLALIFVLLDKRNKYLVWLGEDVLVHLERQTIFGQELEIEGRYEQQIKFGILWRQVLEERDVTERIRAKLHGCVGDSLVVRGGDFSRAFLCGKHRVMLPIVSYLIAVLFLAAGIYIWGWVAPMPSPNLVP